MDVSPAYGVVSHIVCEDTTDLSSCNNVLIVYDDVWGNRSLLSALVELVNMAGRYIMVTEKLVFSQRLISMVMDFLHVFNF